MRSISILVLPLLILWASSPAQAGIVFDFRAPNTASEGSVENQVFNAFSGSNTLTVKTTGNLVGGTPAQNNNANAYRTVWGLGVQNLNDPAGDLSSFFRSIHVDGNSPEFLRLEFSTSVQIKTVVFAYAGAGSTDRFGLAVDGVPVNVASLFGTDVIKNLQPPGFAPGVVHFPTTVPAGRVFDFIAANWGAGAYDEWNLEKMEVVPEPSSLFAWTVAGLGIAVWRRRKKRMQIRAVAS
jgi:hypothetical protein